MARDKNSNPGDGERQAPTSDALAARLPSDPAREAVDSIRGYEWQRWLTALAWLNLSSDQALWIEWGEDLTLADVDGVTTIQAKDRAADITLGTQASQEFIGRALGAPEGVSTVLWTTAQPGLERSNPFGGPGILHWSDVAAGRAPTSKLRAFLQSAAHLDATVKSKLSTTDDDLFRAQLQRISWITGEADLAGVQQQVEAAVAARLNRLVKIPSVLSRKKTFALHILAKLTATGLIADRNLRRLTFEDADEVILQENLAAFAAAAPLFQQQNAALSSLQRAEALVQRLRRIRRLAGFAATSEDPLAEWRALAEELLAGHYDDISQAELREAVSRTAWALSDPTSGDFGQRLLARARDWPESTSLRYARLSAQSFDDPEAVARTLQGDPGPDAFALLFVLIVRRQGEEAALARALQRNAADLSALTALQVLMGLCTQDRWTEALAFSDQITAEQRTQRPFLYLLRGLTLLADVMEPAHRAGLTKHPAPALSSDFRRWINPAAPHLGVRLAAAAVEFRGGEDAARELHQTDVIALCRELRLWVELENPSSAAAAQNELRRRLAAGEDFSSTVSLAIAYEVPFDTAAARHQLDNQIALGGITVQEFRAMMGLFHEPAERLEVIQRHFAAIERFMGTRDAASLRIEHLIRCGRLDEAEAALASIPENERDDANIARLSAVLRGERGGEMSAAMRAIWEQTGEVVDLMNLCVALGQEKRWPALAVAALDLARTTRSEEHLIWVCEAHYEGSTASELLDALAEFPSEVAASSDLLCIWVDQLLGSGRFAEAAPALAKLIEIPDRDERRDDERLLNLAVESGEWEAFASLVDRVWERRDKRSPRALIETAMLAMVRGLEQRARQLASEATGRDDADAPVFLTAWMVANSLGREIDWPESAAWLQRALEKSGPEGPVRAATLPEIADFLPKQVDARTKATDQLNGAEAPLFAFAEVLDIPLSDLVMGCAMRNRTQRDPRKRWLIPIVRGGRPPTPLGEVQRLALDITTLMVLQIIGRLPATLERFDVTLAAGTIRALFLDEQQLKIHGAARSNVAQQVLRRIANGGLVAFNVPSAGVSNLSECVGSDLADLIVHARTQGLRVCRTFPVHRPGSLTMEVADVSGEMDVLVGVDQLANRVQRAGRMPSPDLAACRARLKLLDHGWADALPLGESGVVVDEISLRHLQLSGLLDAVIEASGGVLFVPQGVIDQARQEVANGANAAALLAEINALRSTLRDFIKAGKTRIAPAPDEPEPEGRHPTLRLFRIQEVDAFALDDRSVNSFGQVAGDDGTRPLCTSLDIIEELGANRLSEDEVLASASEFTRCGFLFAPITPRRLLRHLTAAVHDDVFAETAELRTIREYVLRVQLYAGSVLAQEAEYFDGLRLTIAEGIHAWWAKAPSLESAQAGADWLLTVLPDPRDLGHLWKTPLEGIDPSAQFAAQMAAVSFPRLMPLERLQAFSAWSEDRICGPASDLEPEVFARIVEDAARMFSFFDQEVEGADA